MKAIHRLIPVLVIFLLSGMQACTKDEPVATIPPATDSPDPNPGTPEIPDSGNDEFPVPCTDGMAGSYPCSEMDLLYHLDLKSLGASSANDIWGWTDSADGSEYALVGLDNGTAFLSLPKDGTPVYLGSLGTQTSASAWRDIKVYRDHAFIVSEAEGHGMQIFDLTKLRNISDPPVYFSAGTLYAGFGNAHNLVIDEDTGIAYAVGTDRGDLYGGGVHFIDISDPANPLSAGGYGGSGYTHDAQVVTYNGPDTDYSGREIFIGANEDKIVLLDVTDKSNPAKISELSYPNLGYTHQGWFTENKRYFLLGDELDEISFGFNSRTLVFDFSDLDLPQLHYTYSGTTTAIDHNGYVLGDRFYLANYTAGFRLVDISQLPGRFMEETAYFDTHPESDRASFDGVWSIYPFLPSGRILLNDISGGFFMVVPGTSETLP